MYRPVRMEEASVHVKRAADAFECLDKQEKGRKKGGGSASPALTVRSRLLQSTDASQPFPCLRLQCVKGGRGGRVTVVANAWAVLNLRRYYECGVGETGGQLAGLGEVLGVLPEGEPPAALCLSPVVIPVQVRSGGGECLGGGGGRRRARSPRNLAG